jgi:hypothetical protein
MRFDVCQGYGMPPEKKNLWRKLPGLLRKKTCGESCRELNEAAVNISLMHRLARMPRYMELAEPSAWAVLR